MAEKHLPEEKISRQPPAQSTEELRPDPAMARTVGVSGVRTVGVGMGVESSGSDPPSRLTRGEEPIPLHLQQEYR